MALNSKHPSYARHVDDWTMMRDAYAGERTVKLRGMVYLPPTPGQAMDGALTGDTRKAGYHAYNAYKARAAFPDYVSDAVERYIGMLHYKPATIELPESMEPLREKATIDGESLQELLRRINEQQLVTGRLGLLLDFPATPVTEAALPYIAMYCGETVINWDNSVDHVGVNALTMVVLDESGPVRQNNFEWTDRERYRVLQLGTKPILDLTTSSTDDEAVTRNGDSITPDDPTEGVGESVYMQGAFEVTAGTGFDPAQMKTPVYRGATLGQIPFVFINSKDIVPEPDNPPLLGLCRVCMTIYRGDADYRHTLFMQGQDTLVTIGTIRQEGEQVDTDSPLRVGAGAHIGLDIGGDAKYVGIGADGIEGQRLALNDDKQLAQAKAGTLISPTAGKQESGDALTTRLAAQTASLRQIAEAGAAGLQNILRIAAVWLGADPEKVSVSPNTEFAILPVTGQELGQLMAARTMGAPISLESIHSVLVDRGLAKFDYETELEKIAEEDADRAKRLQDMTPQDGNQGTGNPQSGDGAV